MKNMKKWGMGLIALSIFSFIMGVAMKPKELMNVYSSEGGKTFAEFFPAILITSAIICIIIGVYFVAIDKKPVEKRIAKVLETNKANITVEFNDGTRKVLFNMMNVPVVNGDSGLVSYKGNLLVEFNKE